MADMSHVVGRVRNPGVQGVQMAYVDTSAVNWVKADLATNIIPRC